MPSSGSVDYTCNALDIITGAYQNIGMMGEGRTLSAYRAQLGMDKLNVLVKQLAGQSDFSTGFKTWSRKRGFLFLQKDTNVYSIPTSPSSNNYIGTTLAANASLGATSITVTSATGFAAGVNVGVVLDDGSLFWTTESGAPAGSVITLAGATTAAASAGNVVFSYAVSATTRKPLAILAVNMRNIDGTDDPVGMMSIEAYEAIPNKSAETSVQRIYYEPKTLLGTLFLDGVPTDVTRVMRFAYLATIEDFDALTDTVDYPQSWYRYLQLQLGADLGLVFQRPMTAEYKLALDEARAIAKNDVAETTEVYFQPGIDE
jgi:hypothetical protein